jgi:hypothetical protein
MEGGRLLSPDQSAALLEAALRTVLAEAGALGAEAMRWHPAEGEWCANEVVGHLLEAERRGFAGRIRRIIERPGGRLETWDQEQVARERRDCERDSVALLREFQAAREKSVRLVRGLRPEQLELAGEHVDVGTLRVIDLLHEWPHHDRAHVRQTMGNVQASLWPHMGNAQRFSALE